MFGASSTVVLVLSPSGKFTCPHIFKYQDMGALTENTAVGSKEPIFKKLGISPKSLKLDVDSLKDWMVKHPHFPNVDHLNLDSWLENQMILAKNSLEKAKSNIEKYFSVKNAYSELFEKSDDMETNLNQHFENVTIAFLPGVTESLQHVCISRIECDEIDDIHIELIIKRCISTIELCLKEGIDFASFRLIYDMKNFKLHHLASFKLSAMRHMTIVMKAFPFSISKFELINCPPFIEKVLALFKPFLSSKLYSRIVIVKDLEVLKKELGDVKLPHEYDETNPVTQREYSDLTRSKCNRIKEYISQCNEAKCDKNFNVFKNHTPDSGMVGSFRSLKID